MLKNIMFGYVGKIETDSIIKYLFISIVSFFRGRVGYNGQTHLESFAANLNDAKRFFCQK